MNSLMTNSDFTSNPRFRVRFLVPIAALGLIGLGAVLLPTNRPVPASVAHASVSSVGIAPATPTQDDDKRARFMRQKLEYSQKLLEGLVLENYDLIIEAGRSLRRLSEAAEWEVVMLPNTDYVRYSGEFQNLAQDLVKHAQNRNLDAATVASTQMTINCVNCHKYARIAPRIRDGEE
ncbi:hypothetical protein Isop_2470 [Isosphaera pallida ATCC 43644]|uniref:Uncharacterized protein n=2 Tax=Isosphaera pallida TaxID=128 RepID=E8QXJ5_ISOPI|nr:hypothetical protein Isop_2470 [Isosphaera pallida ATCC 43644]